MSLADGRIFHININCRDLERSRRFYEEALGFTSGAHTAPDAVQSGAAFGLGEAMWDAWIMLGASGYNGGAIDLLEWQQPPPVGAPPQRIVDAGFQRIGVSVDDLSSTLARVTAFGGEVWSEPFGHALDSGGEIRLVFASDPDGTAIELIEARDGPRLSFVAVTCTDLAASVAFYQSLGFRELARFASRHDDNSHLRISSAVDMEEVVLRAPGGGEVTLMLAGFDTPAVTRAAQRAANTVGMWRGALLVGDLDATCAQLTAAEVELLSPPVSMAMGPGLPELRFVCCYGPDGEVIEFIESPR